MVHLYLGFYLEMKEWLFNSGEGVQCDLVCAGKVLIYKLKAFLHTQTRFS